MSEVRIRIYEDQFEGLRVEVDGQTMTPGTTIKAMIDNVDVAAWLRQVFRNMQRAGYLENTEVTS